MTSIDPNQSQRLDSGGVVTLPVRPRAAIRCDSGALWITQDADPRDVVLGPGETFLPDRNGPLTLSAFEPSAYSFAFESSSAATQAKARSARRSPCPRPECVSA